MKARKDEKQKLKEYKPLLQPSSKASSFPRILYSSIDRSFPSSKNFLFQNKAKYKTFLCFHINDFALRLALKQRPQGQLGNGLQQYYTIKSIAGPYISRQMEFKSYTKGVATSFYKFFWNTRLKMKNFFISRLLN